jgi:hypothetical protein
MCGSLELIAEVVPGVVAAVREAMPAPADRPASVFAGLGREQKSDPGTDRQAEDHAGREQDPTRLPSSPHNASIIGTCDGDWPYRTWLDARRAPSGRNGAGV